MPWQNRIASPLGDHALINSNIIFYCRPEPYNGLKARRPFLIMDLQPETNQSNQPSNPTETIPHGMWKDNCPILSLARLCRTLMTFEACSPGFLPSEVWERSEDLGYSIGTSSSDVQGRRSTLFEAIRCAGEISFSPPRDHRASEMLVNRFLRV